jgi:SAM-dependent methyltransferase
MAESNRFVLRLGAQAVDALPPRFRRPVRSMLGRPGPRVVALAQLDAELARATALMEPDPDRARALLDGIVLALPVEPPADPFAEAYREWAWDLYRAISGRAGYDTANEASPFDLAAALERPFPYQTGSLALVGRDLVARGHLLECLGEAIRSSAEPRRVVEFGPGWGNLTHDLVATGLDVTAVELDEKFCRVIEHRCEGPGRATVLQGDMLGFTAEQPFDAAVFFESFHHCADHLAMLRHLHDIVRPDGVVVFASEPIQKMDYPWGPRLDGLSLWSSRTYGWLELGFDSAYFDRALAQTGWTATRHRLGPGAGESDVLVARAAPGH